MFHILLGTFLIVIGLAWIVIDFFASAMEDETGNAGVDPYILLGLVPIALGVLAIFWW